MVREIKKPVEMKVKICLLGECAVGKTSLIGRYVGNMFKESYLPTVGTRDYSMLGIIYIVYM